MTHGIPTTAEMLGRRLKNFKVEVRKSKFVEFDEVDEFVLSVSHNEFQWNAIGLLPNEARKVILALENYLTTLEAPQQEEKP